MSLDQSLQFIKKEWEKMPPAVKYTLIWIIISLFYLWFDRFVDINLYKKIIFIDFSMAVNDLDASQSIFFFINLLTATLFSILLLGRTWIDIKKIYYKIKYPLKKLNETYYLVSGTGSKKYLLDSEKKELLWIKSWETALDLDFIGEWMNISKTHDLSESLTRGEDVTIEFGTKNGSIKLKDYKYNPKGIRTQSVLWNDNNNK